MVNAQEWLDKEYPKEDKKGFWEITNLRLDVKSLDISNKNLEGKLNLSEFINLKELNCSRNKLTELNVSKLRKLKRLDCSRNLLVNLDLSSLNPEKLTSLVINNNNFAKQDLSFLIPFNNLEEIKLGMNIQGALVNFLSARWYVYNRFYGSLEPLKSMTKLRTLAIQDTDVNSGLEYLPDSVEKFYCYPYRSDAGVQSIYNLLDGIGDCCIKRTIKRCLGFSKISEELFNADETSLKKENQKLKEIIKEYLGEDFLRTQTKKINNNKELLFIVESNRI